MDKFSAEEINLMCIYDTASRQNLLSDLRAGLADVYEPEMREVFESAIAKLEAMSDEDFSGIGFYVADEFDDDLEGSYIAG
jgi:primase-polymerase (primpol)-like protein